MAKSLSKTGLITGTTVEAWHVTQSIDAFAGTDAYDIIISGSLRSVGPLDVTGSSHTIKGNTQISQGNITLSGNTTVNGYTLQVGLDNVTTGTYSLSQGLMNQSLGSYASSFGRDNITIGDSSQTFGSGSLSSGSSQLVCGRYNTHGDNTSLLIVGNGTRDNDRIDAFKVTHSGSIVVPTSSIEPNWAGQEGEIIPYNSGGNWRLYMWMNGAWRFATFS
tara:strand:- start:4548 stop:5204 length:657 start_codon:yes stop_codon:yes gene_type:complete